MYSLRNWLWCLLELWGGRPSPKTPPPVCRGVDPLHISMDAACVLEKMGNEKHAYFHKSWGD